VAGERRWMAFLNVSASGPFKMASTQRGMFYPKSLAQLEYTHADATYYSRFWQEKGGWPWPDVLTQFVNHDLVGAQFSDIERAFDEATGWFTREAEEDPAFDGGGIHFTFSGHGGEDGVLVLENDTFFAARDLVTFALDAHSAAKTDQQTNLVVYLDSCHSGAFILDLLEIIMSECRDELSVFRATASCYADELSYEVPELGHGLATYCASIRPDRIDSLMARAGLKQIPLWGVIKGPGGCSLVTMGKQNPIVVGSYGHVEACNRESSLYSDEWQPRLRAEWETDLCIARDEFRAAVAALYNQPATPDNNANLAEHLESLMVLGSFSFRREVSASVHGTEIIE
jgi:hypothetical protein